MSRGPVSPTRTTHPVSPVPAPLYHLRAPLVAAVSVYSVPTGADTAPLGGPVPVRKREAGTAPMSAGAWGWPGVAAAVAAGVAPCGAPVARRAGGVASRVAM